MTAPTWTAWIADLAGSRELSADERSAVQERLLALMPTLDDLAGDALASHFVVTTGDEFQGLLRSPAPLPDLLWAVGVTFRGPRIRVGIGHGTLSTGLRPDRAIGMDGPAFHRARAAIEHSERTADDAPVFRSTDPEVDRVLDGLGRALATHRRRWTDRQRDVASRLRAGASQGEVATALGITQQAVSKHVAKADLAADAAIEDGLGAALGWFDRRD